MTGHPLTHANQAASAITKLARTTRPAITTLDTAGLYAITGALADLAAALPQVLTQLTAQLPDPNQEPPISQTIQTARTAATMLYTALEALGC